ncbi:MAG: threonine/serine exporter family protein [Oscillospiraceae bacterium]|nr:threonine/serine exporter family protein [Oscillospiraceae bacterium]
MYEEQQDQGERIAALALDLGRQLLVCGADVNRAEDTAKRICRSYGAQVTEVFCIGSLLMATVEWINGTRTTQIRNIQRVSYDLARLEELNTLSRDLCEKTISPETARNRLTALRTPSRQKPLVTHLAGILAVVAYTLFFNGTLADAVAAALCGVLVTALDRRMPGRSSMMMRTVLSAIGVGVITGLCHLVYPALHTDHVMIGAIMLMVPGLMIASSLRDLLNGDIIAGSLQLIQAILTAGALALGLAWASSWMVTV